MVRSIDILDGAVGALLRTHPLPGLAAAVVSPTDGVVFRCAGLADLDAGRDVTADTTFRLDSVSKILVAVCVLQLADAGLVDLDAPANEHLTTLRVCPPRRYRTPVTARHLLTHTSGLPADYPWLRLIRRPGEADDALSRVYGPTVRGTEAPGGQVIYSNHNYSVLAQLVGDVSGQPFARRVQESVLRPLGLRRTGYGPPADPDDRAVGYAWFPDRFRPTTTPESRLTAALGAHSCAADLTRLCAAVLPGGPLPSAVGGRLVGAATVRAMMSSQFRLTDDGPGFGLGFELKAVGDTVVAYRNAFSAGSSCTVQLVPDRGLALVLLTNTSALRVLDVLGDVVLERLMDVPATGPGRRAVAERRAVPAGLAGTYARGGGRLRWRGYQCFDVRAGAAGLDLTLTWPAEGEPPKTVPLSPADPDDPLAYEVDPRATWGFGFGQGIRPCPVRFLPGSSGRAGTLVFQSVVAARRRRRYNGPVEAVLCWVAIRLENLAGTLRRARYLAGMLVRRRVRRSVSGRSAPS